MPPLTRYSSSTKRRTRLSHDEKNTSLAISKSPSRGLATSLNNQVGTNSTSGSRKKMQKRKPRSKISPHHGLSRPNKTTVMTTNCCCLCHCSLDFSDRDACFSLVATNNNLHTSNGINEFSSSPSPPTTTPLLFYDVNNALIQCGSCSRAYHQHCHFVPILTIPQNNKSSIWQCLVCTTADVESQDSVTQLFQSLPAQRQNNNMHNDYNNKTHTHAEQNDDFGKSKQLVKLEQEWEFRVRGAKAQGLHSELARWKRSTQAHIQRHQRASATLDILSANARNRQHFLNNALFHSSETANTFLTTCSKSELQQSDKDNSGNNEDNNSTKNDTHKKKNKQTAMGSGVSQEWMQCVNSLALAQRNLRRLLQSLQNVQRSATSRSTWDDLLRQYHDNALVFPHGMNMPLMRRWTPVTDEYYLDTSRNDEPTSSTNSGVPSEVLVVTTAQSFAFLDSAKIAVVGKKATPVKKATTTTKKKNVTKELYIHDKHDDGISLDQLQCCICLEGECNDDNDLLLCDGNGCYRSYHMECVYPHVLLETAANEDEDWFCPLCETLADALYQVQASTVGGGDEWEDRRLHRREQEKVKASNHTKSKKGCDTILDDVGSLVSWSDAADAFPNAEWTYKTAMEMQKGVRNADTQRLVFQVMGITSTFTGEDESKHVSREINRSDVDNEEEEDDDNVDEDGHFDMYSYEEERRIEREERHHEENDVDSNSVSTHSSQVTLVELSSVEMHVGKDELAALTDVDEEDASSSESPLVRQSRRLRSLKDLHQENRNGSSKRSNATANLGMMNKANIVAGKRKRRQVDYRQLNAAIFGDVTDSALETMDGGDDFVFDSSKNAFNSDDDDNDEDSETDDENDGGDIDGDSDVER